MDEQILNQYYQKIAEKIEDVIPVEWYDVALYMEDVGDASSLTMYFREEKEGEYVYMMDIPEVYGVDEDEYEERERELEEACSNLRKEFKNQEVEPWNIFEFYLNQDYTFKVNFSYEYDENISSYDRSIVWKYRQSGIMPKGSFEERILNEYVDCETGELKKKM